MEKKLDAGMDQDEAIGEGNMKAKMDTSDVRLQCRISCGPIKWLKMCCNILCLPILCVINVRYDDDDDD